MDEENVAESILPFPIARGLMLVVFYVGYMMHTYSRRSFQNCINYVLKDKIVNEEDIGLIVSSQQISYTCCRFIQPFVLDKLNPKCVFLFSMGVSFFTLSCFSFARTASMMLIFYAIQGFFLAFSWPSLAKMMTKMISHSTFGFWWSVECTSSNVGAIFGSIVSTVIADRYGWYYSMRFCALMNLFCFLMILPLFVFIPIPSNENEKSEELHKDNGSVKFSTILFNPILIANGFMFFSVYICRFLMLDWYQIHLNHLKFPQIFIASFISMIEIGGTFGSIFAGIMADMCYINLVQYRNPRLFVIIGCGICVIFTQTILLFIVSSTTPHIILNTLGFIFGFFLYGPVSIGGIIALEAAPVSQQCLSYTINILYSNAAMLLSGYPLSVIAYKLGWRSTFIICNLCLITATLFMIFVRKMKTPIELHSGRDFSSEISQTISVKKEDWENPWIPVSAHHLSYASESYHV